MGLGDLKLDDMIVVALVGCLAATTLTMTVLTFRLPNKGAVLKEQGFQVAHGDFCDTLYVSHVRPFRFAIAKYDGTFSCPWPGTNTALRAALALGGLAATAGEACMKLGVANGPGAAAVRARRATPMCLLTASVLLAICTWESLTIATAVAPP
jgi:hypothetical protein